MSWRLSSKWSNSCCTSPQRSSSGVQLLLPLDVHGRSAPERLLCLEACSLARETLSRPVGCEARRGRIAVSRESTSPWQSAFTWESQEQAWVPASPFQSCDLASAGQWEGGYPARVWRSTKTSLSSCVPWEYLGLAGAQMLLFTCYETCYKTSSLLQKGGTDLQSSPCLVPGKMCAFRSELGEVLS